MQYTVEVKNGGRVQFPKELRDALKLTDGSKVTIEPQDGFVKVMTVEQRLAKVRRILHENPNWQGFSVDDFIQEKREEARREMEEITDRDDA